jgi:hypothetical protein
VEGGDLALQRLEALGDGRVVVLARDGAADVGDREPRVREPAGRGDDAQMRLVGVSPWGSEVLERRAAHRRALGEHFPAADAAQGHGRTDAAADLVLFEHVCRDRRGTESVRS